HGLKAGFEQQLLEERVANLHIGALCFGLFTELLARHGRAVNAVAPSLRPDVDNGIAFTRGPGIEDLVAAYQAQGKCVYQWIPRVAALELYLAPDIWDAKAIAVRRDAAYHAFEYRMVLVQSRLIEPGLWRDWAEAQGVHNGHRPRAHGEDVAQNTAHASGRALEGLDERWVVVRLDFESASPAVADVNDACVLSWALYHAAAVRREPLQVHPRRLVGAVLAPHHAENTQLRERRLAAQRFQNAVVFFWRDPMVTEHFWGDGGFFSDAGRAFNWVHGDKEGSSIVARTTGLGKEMS